MHFIKLSYFLIASLRARLLHQSSCRIYRCLLTKSVLGGSLDVHSAELSPSAGGSSSRLLLILQTSAGYSLQSLC